MGNVLADAWAAMNLVKLLQWSFLVLCLFGVVAIANLSHSLANMYLSFIATTQLGCHVHPTETDYWTAKV